MSGWLALIGRARSARRGGAGEGCNAVVASDLHLIVDGSLRATSHARR